MDFLEVIKSLMTISNISEIESIISSWTEQYLGENIRAFDVSAVWSQFYSDDAALSLLATLDLFEEIFAPRLVPLFYAH